MVDLEDQQTIPLVPPLECRHITSGRIKQRRMHEGWYGVSLSEPTTKYRLRSFICDGIHVTLEDLECMHPAHSLCQRPVPLRPIPFAACTFFLHHVLFPHSYPVRSEDHSLAATCVKWSRHERGTLAVGWSDGRISFSKISASERKGKTKLVLPQETAGAVVDIRCDVMGRKMSLFRYRFSAMITTLSCRPACLTISEGFAESLPHS